MKKLILVGTLLSFIICQADFTQAIDFKITGRFISSFDYGQNGKFMGEINGHKITGYNGTEDDFEARQRLRLKLDAIASESLSGTVQIEIGKVVWGKAGDSRFAGGALGADSNIVRVKAAYLDWSLPNGDLKVRMGLQPISLPAYAYASGSFVMADDAAGIVASYKINEKFGVSAF